VRRLVIIGIGTGDPEQLTGQAVQAMRAADVFLAFDKGEHAPGLLRLREHLCERVLGDQPHRFVTVQDPERDRGATDYGGAVDTWHARRAERLAATLDSELADGKTAAILVWGDPALYDSTVRLVDTLAGRPGTELEYEVIPGISSLQLLAARHGISLHRVGGSVLVTTGRRLRAGIPAGADDIVVMLDGECSFTTLDHPEDYDIAWGAYLGTQDEILVSGNLPAVSEEIQRVRAEARERLGWVMDIYLLRRVEPGRIADSDPCAS
jgi:precorrin-6A synthase